MSDARIVDRGYRRYDGPRRGVRGAVRSLAWHSALRALGLRRTFWAKLLPLASVGIAYVPALVFVGIAALLPDQLVQGGGVLPGYADYYGFISAAIVLFVALVGPEVLCPDRRHRMLGLYLASPLTRDSYLVAKVLAVVPVLALVTLGPPLLLLVGLTFAGAGPEGFGEFLTVLARIVTGGLVISAAYTAVSLAAASLTERRAVASAGVILVLLVSTVATTVLVATGVDERLLLLNLAAVPFELVQRIYGEVGQMRASTTELVVANLAWTVGAGALLRSRYHRLRITR
ncbi:MAG: ABC transporter permease subunit [Actinomycetota bacterium]|nr:ABC transporter permease subunit [Actinomycetota bacterium]